MGKNIVVYTRSSDFRNKEGFILKSSKEDLLEKLHYFNGMVIDHAEIKDGYRYKEGSKKGLLSGRYLSLYIYIQRHIQAFRLPLEDGRYYEEEEVTSDTCYSFDLTRGWKLYDKDILVYDDESFSNYADPKPYEKRFLGIKLLKADIDPAWRKANLIFDTNLRIEIMYRVTNNKRSEFFAINRQAEPFRMHLDFGKHDSIICANESVQLEVSERKNRPNFII